MVHREHEGMTLSRLKELAGAVIERKDDPSAVQKIMDALHDFRAACSPETILSLPDEAEIEARAFERAAEVVREFVKEQMTGWHRDLAIEIEMMLRAEAARLRGKKP